VEPIQEFHPARTLTSVYRKAKGVYPNLIRIPRHDYVGSQGPAQEVDRIPDVRPGPTLFEFGPEHGCELFAGHESAPRFYREVDKQRDPLRLSQNGKYRRAILSAKVYMPTCLELDHS